MNLYSTFICPNRAYRVCSDGKAPLRAARTGSDKQMVKIMYDVGHCRLP